jgi:hypothetical protein
VHAVMAATDAAAVLVGRRVERAPPTAYYVRDYIAQDEAQALMQHVRMDVHVQGCGVPVLTMCACGGGVRHRYILPPSPSGACSPTAGCRTGVCGAAAWLCKRSCRLTRTRLARGHADPQGDGQ